MEMMKVLIVDDEPNMRFVLSEALTKEGYACSEAGDGLQAMERIKEDLPDIVVLDLKMPRMGGMETLRKIHGLDPDMAVIIITAFGTRETAYEAMREGAYDYFSKPVNIHEVRGRRQGCRARTAREDGQADPGEGRRLLCCGGRPGQGSCRSAPARAPAQAFPERKHGTHHRRERHGQGARR